jgi:AraC-like DNA-binding protein
MEKDGKNMDISIKQKSILQIGAERVLENLCDGRVVFLSKPEPFKKTTTLKVVPSKTGYPLDKHRHAEIAQLVCGQGQLKLSQGAIDLLPNKLVFISPDTLHGETYHKYGSSYTLLWIVFYPNGIGFFLCEYNGLSFSIRPERYMYETPASCSIWNITTTRDLSTHLLNRARMHEYLLHACCEVIERSNDRDEMPNYPPKLVEQIRCYIDLHYTEPIILKELSQIAHCSPNHLSTLFRKYVGIPIRQYILQQRLREAKRLLENSECTIKEAAYRLGFNDPLYFSRIFKKYFLVPPSKIG